MSRSYVRSLYKNILSEASYFFDDRTRAYIKNKATKTFKEYKHCQDVDRIKYKIREGRKHLHRLERANRGHHKCALTILNEAYGQTGKTRHALLYPYLHAHQEDTLKIQSEPFVPHAPRTAPPPILCPPLRPLVMKILGKPLLPQLPEPQYKPLHPGRKANLLWKHYSMLLERVPVPLPFEIVCELEHKAGAPMTHPLSCSQLVTGGPRWDDFYGSLTNTISMMPHLQPKLVLTPPTKVIRRQILPESPYSNARPSLLDYLEHEDRKKPDPVPYTSREQKRLYRRLLGNIPLLPVFSAKELWKEGKQYKVSRSHWIPRGVTQLLDESQIPPDSNKKQPKIAKKQSKKVPLPK